jgi:hypothetical protein
VLENKFKTDQNGSVGLKNKFKTKQNGSVGLVNKIQSAIKWICCVKY